MKKYALIALCTLSSLKGTLTLPGFLTGESSFKFSFPGMNVSPQLAAMTGYTAVGAAAALYGVDKISSNYFTPGKWTPGKIAALSAGALLGGASGYVAAARPELFTKGLFTTAGILLAAKGFHSFMNMKKPFLGDSAKQEREHVVSTEAGVSGSSNLAQEGTVFGVDVGQTLNLGENFSNLLTSGSLAGGRYSVDQSERLDDRKADNKKGLPGLLSQSLVAVNVVCDKGRVLDRLQPPSITITIPLLPGYDVQTTCTYPYAWKPIRKAQDKYGLGQQDKTVILYAFMIAAYDEKAQMIHKNIRHIIHDRSISNTLEEKVVSGESIKEKFHIEDFEKSYEIPKAKFFSYGFVPLAFLKKTQDGFSVLQPLSKTVEFFIFNNDFKKVVIGGGDDMGRGGNYSSTGSLYSLVRNITFDQMRSMMCHDDQITKAVKAYEEFQQEKLAKELEK